MKRALKCKNNRFPVKIPTTSILSCYIYFFCVHRTHKKYRKSIIIHLKTISIQFSSLYHIHRRPLMKFFFIFWFKCKLSSHMLSIFISPSPMRNNPMVLVNDFLTFFLWMAYEEFLTNKNYI